ncbi:increased loss of mitochondrial DNA protein 1 [Massariosphaeria phaeospora]|uniref:Increased loss of mitochondrial DNA protein 1 n=1 Tax=Massariosphaeria phaeospora TaxID=100035 RepID=A0A7C8MLQ6_9PLEO|nr:increased loss of mitochondrial DNA protein 1 [Massariosphaeria phaeospora]
MAIISAYTIIRGLALFHLALAVFFLKSPQTIADQNVVFILGEAMRLPTPREFSKPSPVTAIVAVLFAFLGLTDLTAVSLPEELADTYWGTQTPVRLSFLFILTGYTYLFKEGGLLASRGAAYTVNAGDYLKNSMVFTWGFLELSAWFWVFVTLRDERRQRGIRLLQKRKAEHALYN